MQRVLHARTLLEQTDLGIESVATRSGFGTAALLRHHFRRVVGVAPQDYRRTFASS
jgi:transcriptional regulator GlxA family with amidase domain